MAPHALERGNRPRAMVRLTSRSPVVKSKSLALDASFYLIALMNEQMCEQHVIAQEHSLRQTSNRSSVGPITIASEPANGRTVISAVSLVCPAKSGTTSTSVCTVAFAACRAAGRLPNYSPRTGDTVTESVFPTTRSSRSQLGRCVLRAKRPLAE